MFKSDKFDHTYCPERRVGLHGVRQVVLQNHPKKKYSIPNQTRGNLGNLVEPNRKGAWRRSTYVEVRWVAADADLDVARLDGAVEELGGHALGEFDVHVHLL